MHAAKDAMAKAAGGLHRQFVRASKGKLFGKAFGMPVVELETTGRRSGKKRSTMLAAAVRDGDATVLVAAYHGDDRNPAWYLNLRENPDVHVTERGQRRAMRARTATGDEREALWAKVVSANQIYAKTQAKTTRQFPVVVLEPA